MSTTLTRRSLAMVPLFFLLISASVASHECIHDRDDVRDVYRRQMDASVAAAPEMHHHFRRTAVADPKSLRIVTSTVDLYDETKYCTAAGQTRIDFLGGTRTCEEEDIFTDDKRDVLLNRVLPHTIQVLGEALLIDQVSGGNLTIPSSCTDTTAPHWGNSFAEADFVLYVTAGPTPRGVLAFAGACHLDGATRRPIAGHANFGQEFMVWNDAFPDSFENSDLLVTGVHETLHALGFSHDFLVNHAAGAPYTAKNVTLRGKTTLVVNTTPVATAAQEYFGCTTLDGLELEDEGGAGSALSHFDRRVVPFEIMTAAGGSILSRFTLAFMEGLGMYRANYSAADVDPALVFGANAGCGFIHELCNTASGGAGAQFCFTEDEEDCTVMHRAVGRCGISTRTDDYPAVFQYFSDPKKGGYFFQDGCPIITAYSNLQCNYGAEVSTANGQLGHFFGQAGRCVRTSNTGASTGLVQSGLSTTGSPFRCLETRCPDGGTRVELKPTNGDWVSCPADGSGGVIAAPAGFTGSITCPTAASICSPDLVEGVSLTAAPMITTGAPSTTTEAPATTSGASATTTGAPASTTAPLTTTAVPSTTTAVDTGYDLQFSSAYSQGQLTASRLDSIHSAIVAAVPASSTVSSVTVLLASVTAATSVIRFTITSAASESVVVAAVQNALADDSSALAIAAQPVDSSFSVVVDCSTVCSATGTSAAARNAANTECRCTCRNSFSGSTCEECDTRYGGSSCNVCADGYFGYPGCDPRTVTCISPNVSRAVVRYTTSCANGLVQNVKVRDEFEAALTTCHTVDCACRNGSYVLTTGTCLGGDGNRTSCDGFRCTMALERCEIEARAAAFLSHGGSCLVDLGTLNASRAVLADFCEFDACVLLKGSCGSDAELRMLCDRSTPDSSAARPRDGVSTSAHTTGALVVFLLLSTTNREKEEHHPSG